MLKFVDKVLELEGETLTIYLMIPDEVLSVKFVMLHFWNWRRLILNRFSGKLEFTEWLISAWVPIDRILIAFHQ